MDSEVAAVEIGSIAVGLLQSVFAAEQASLRRQFEVVLQAQTDSEDSVVVDLLTRFLVTQGIALEDKFGGHSGWAAHSGCFEWAFDKTGWLLLGCTEQNSDPVDCKGQGIYQPMYFGKVPGLPYCFELKCIQLKPGWHSCLLQVSVQAFGVPDYAEQYFDQQDCIVQGSDQPDCIG
jgi:hypothetical protein